MRRFAKSRVEALTDGIFAFAMTLLVLDIRLPADLPISDARELAAQLLGLWPQALTYLISFMVLGALWRSGTELARRADTVSGGLLKLWMLYLFFVTSLPFSSGVVSHYGGMAPAVWLYAANMFVLGALALPLNLWDIARGQEAAARATRLRLLLFMASAGVSALIACLAPRQALYAYALNGLGHLLIRVPPPPRRS